MLNKAKTKLTALYAFVFLALVSLFVPTSQAALTVAPADIYGQVESSFDAAALIGVAILAVVMAIRFIKKALRAT